MSASAKKESAAEAKSTIEEDREKTRGEIEVLILVSGLIMTPLFYLWQTATTVVSNLAAPMWQNYLQAQISHPPPYSFNEAIALYFSPYALVTFLPVDILFWLYDISALLAVITLIVFGFALMEIETGDVKRVHAHVQKGRTCLNTVLLLLIAFVIVHLLNNTILPFKLLLGVETEWATVGIALLTAIALSRFLNTYMKKP